MSCPQVLKFDGEKMSGTQNKSGEAWIVVGKVLKTVGLNGWVRINLLTDNPERFQDGVRLFLKNKQGQVEPVQIDKIKEHFSGTKLDVLFKDIDNCDEASEVVSCFLVIPKSERAKLPEGSFYSDELEGMKVISEGKEVGSVIKLESDVPSPYLSIDAGKHGEIMVPFRKEFIKNISKSGETIVLKHSISFHIPRK